MNTRQYADMFFKCDYAELEPAFLSLRYRVSRRRLANEVSIEVRNSLTDKMVSLFGEGTKGAWRVLRAGRVLAYCFDEDMRHARDITEEERLLLKELGIIM